LIYFGNLNISFMKYSEYPRKTVDQFGFRSFMEKNAQKVLSCMNEMHKEMSKIFKSIKPKKFINIGVKDLTVSQLETIAYLYEHKAAKMSDLANNAGVKMSTMTDMIERLHSLGLVERKHDEKDRRSIVISISKNVLSKVYGHIQDRNEQLAKIMDCLTQKEKQTVIKILTKMLDSLHKKTAGPNKSGLQRG